MFFYGLIYQLIAFIVFKRFSGYFAAAAPAPLAPPPVFFAFGRQVLDEVCFRDSLACALEAPLRRR